MAITPEDLINKSFKIVRNESGYDRDEVDNYLDELVVELRALYTENESLKRKLAAAQSGSATQATNNTSSSSATAKSAAQDKTSTPAPVAAGGAQDAAGLLAMAQKLHDEYVSQGEKTRAELVAKGEKEAKDLVAAARSQRDEVLSKLTDERDSLEITVESLRGFESRYRSKLQEHLTSQLEELKTLKSFEADAR